MRVLTIPDCHLKPWMFTQAAEHMREQEITQAVCLMDIADDWNQQRNLELYRDTYDAAITFAKEYPNTLWCFGNHDLSYVWEGIESGYSYAARHLVCEELRKLRGATKNGQMAYVHKIDNVIFSHAGLMENYVEWYVPIAERKNTDSIIRAVNKQGYSELWRDSSPIWSRPQIFDRKPFGEGKLIQVAGHTPVESIRRVGNIIYCDTFSTDSAGNNIGTKEFLIIDTESLEYYGLT